jgi:RNA:NAD 2'-phosphotransferase (TPT1/KptA family)
MSTVLRHKAVEIGIQIDSAGYVKINDLIHYLHSIKGLKDIKFEDI